MAGPHIVVYGLPGKDEKKRLGVSVSRKVGNAVIRNRVRRRISEAFAAQSVSLPAGLDVVIIARKPAAGTSYHILEEELADLFNKLARKMGSGAPH